MVERSLGEVYFGTGAVEPAAEHMEAAARTLEQLANRPGAAAPDYGEASSVYGTLGDLYSGSFVGKLDATKADKYFQRQIALNHKALALDPNYLRSRRGIAIAK